MTGLENKPNLLPKNYGLTGFSVRSLHISTPMKTILLFICSYYKNHLLLLIFALGLVILRILYTTSFFYTFLLWNLFLAILPYVLTQSVYFYGYHRIPSVLKIALMVVWLLLLPNAPYLVTDLIHLHNDSSNWKWPDLFLVFVFASIGVLFGSLSLLDTYQFLNTKWNTQKAGTLVLVLCLLTGHGIYLGRFQRFNSWDVLFKPKAVFASAVQSLGNPKVWWISVAFGLFIWLLFSLLKWIKENA